MQLRFARLGCTSASIAGNWAILLRATRCSRRSSAVSKLSRGGCCAAIATVSKGDLLSHIFYLEVPALENYSYKLLQVNHKISLYPLSLNANDRGWVECADKDQFVNLLKQVFTHEGTKRVIQALLAQADARAEAVLA